MPKHKSPNLLQNVDIPDVTNPINELYINITKGLTPIEHKNPTNAQLSKINKTNSITTNANEKLPEWTNIKDVESYENSITNDRDKILSINHNNNFAILDKKNNVLEVYDKDKNLLFSTNRISTGRSANDYNTISYTNGNGEIALGKGNESTPAGISEITSINEYHGYPSFQRKREGTNDEIASSIHFGNTDNKNNSNGCVRMNGEDLKEVSKYFNIGTKIYTLPQKEGSRFVLQDGKLSYVADNPYGDDNINNPKRYWDDYNIYVDKSYSPLKIEANNNTYKGEKITNYIKGLEENKENIQKDLNIPSGLYNKFAHIALGIAGVETEFGTGSRYFAKQIPGLVNTLKFITGNKSANSYGITQMKIDTYNDELKQLFKKYGINKDTIKDEKVAATATMLKLIYSYNNEIKGKRFTDKNGNEISLDDAIIASWNYGTPKLKKGNIPTNYINSTKQFMNMFNLYTNNGNNYNNRKLNTNYLAHREQ